MSFQLSPMKKKEYIKYYLDNIISFSVMIIQKEGKKQQNGIKWSEINENNYKKYINEEYNSYGIITELNNMIVFDFDIQKT